MIEVRNLRKSFGTSKVLDGISFRIEKGESVVIIGRSGGGKSILLKHIIGLLQPDSGQVLIENEDIVMNEPSCWPFAKNSGCYFRVRRCSIRWLRKMSRSHFSETALPPGSGGRVRGARMGSCRAPRTSRLIVRRDEERWGLRGRLLQPRIILPTSRRPGWIHRRGQH
jgi:energy-coupling factor transporter ATP-binding protein EcfA2